jgi:transmembrane sensor
MTKMQKETEEQLLLKVIEGRADDRETELFNQWVKSSAKNGELFAQLKEVYHLSSFGHHSAQANWERVVDKVRSGYTVPDFIELPLPARAGNRLLSSPLLRVAATIAVLIGISVFLWVVVFNPEQLIVSGNDLNKNEPYRMEDGSLVFLNGDSEISISNRFGSKEREVLLTGEAYFDVKRDAAKPFVVKANSTITKVLGTSFNVYSDQSGHVKVSVTSGLVEFTEQEADDILQISEGEQGTFDPVEKTVEKFMITDPNFQAWRTGVFIFRDTPIDQALEMLGEHYSRIFLLEGIGDRIGSITTTFDNQPLAAVQEELSLLLNAKTESKNDTIIFKTAN